MNRRNFFSGLLKGMAVVFLGCVRGSLLNSKTISASDGHLVWDGGAQNTESFEVILSRTTMSNVYEVLKTSSLKKEEKMAILAVREISRDEIQRSLSPVKSRRESSGEWKGNYCGNGCPGAGGSYCGNKCTVTTDAVCVLDKDGRLNIDIAAMSKQKFENALRRALDLTR
jgi:hypothetical protein